MARAFTPLFDAAPVDRRTKIGAFITHGGFVEEGTGHEAHQLLLVLQFLDDMGPASTLPALARSVKNVREVHQVFMREHASAGISAWLRECPPSELNIVLVLPRFGGAVEDFATVDELVDSLRAAAPHELRSTVAVAVEPGEWDALTSTGHFVGAGALGLQDAVLGVYQTISAVMAAEATHEVDAFDLTHAWGTAFSPAVVARGGWNEQTETVDVKGDAAALLASDAAVVTYLGPVVKTVGALRLLVGWRARIARSAMVIPSLCLGHFAQGLPNACVVVAKPR